MKWQLFEVSQNWLKLEIPQLPVIHVLSNNYMLFKHKVRFLPENCKELVVWVLPSPGTAYFSIYIYMKIKLTIKYFTTKLVIYDALEVDVKLS